MTDTIILLMVMTALLNFVLSIVILLNRNAAASFWFGIFNLFLGAWTLTIIGYRLSTDPFAAQMWMRAAYVSAIFIALPFWYFARQFPKPKPLHWSREWMHWGVAGAFSVAILATGAIVHGVTVLPSGVKDVIQNPVGWFLYAVLFLFYFLSAHLILFLKYVRSQGLSRTHLRYLFSSVFLGGEVFGVFFNLLLPSPIFDEWRYIWTGPVLTAIVIVPTISYAITRYQLLDIKVIATEALVLGASILAFVDIFFARNNGEILFRTFIFLAVCLLGYLIIRSVLNEIHRREEVQRLAEDLKAANVKLEELSEMKSNFISIASHQLRAPIGGVRAYLAMMRDGDFGKFKKKVNDVLDLNLETLGHLLQVIETFLNVTRFEAGKISIQEEPVDLCEIAQGVYKELQMVADRKKITFTLSCAKASVIVTGDREKLRNVLFNYVENALKYTESGSIMTTVVQKGSEVEVRVTDTGIGIDPAEVPNLFAKFVRAGGGFKIAHGSGLGLYVAKMLTEAHGGSIFVESPGVGKGSTFGFRLPIRKGKALKKS